ncbi:MAG: hypothetical protein GTN64_05505 [Candidatus Latescibacteria bacterium]|nr:hypothetical protein [Candidatus Latescibacterota bacterium]NIO78066.1 hypothetical protein [Candidatus Latescibacterota bacterium]
MGTPYTITLVDANVSKVAQCLRDVFGEVYVDPEATPLVPVSDIALIEEHTKTFIRKLELECRQVDARETHVDPLTEDTGLFE